MTTQPDWPRIIDSIAVGGEWTLEVLVTSEDGSPLTGWTGRAQVRDSWTAATDVFTLGASGDGTITFADVDDTWSLMTLHLPATFTEGLSAGSSPVGTPRVVVGDIEAWDPAASTVKYRVADLRLYIRPNATTS